MEGFSQLRTHSLDLAARCASIKAIHVVVAQGSVPHQCRDAHRGLSSVDGRNVGSERGIAKGARVAEEVHWIRRISLELHRRCADAAIANDHCCHSLRQLRQHLRSSDHVCIVMSMDIDKAGREDLSVAVHYMRSRQAQAWSESADAATINGDIDGLIIAAASINYADIPDKGVEDRHRNSIKVIRNSSQRSIRGAILALNTAEESVCE